MSSAVRRYHDGTKHHFNQFARSLGYLDWASQPNPFRSFEAAKAFALFPAPEARAAGDSALPVQAVTYRRLFDAPTSVRSISATAIGDLLRHALGLSAWKVYRPPGASTSGERAGHRWSLRVNPSSGNLHPTEAYVVCGALPGLAASAGVYHYAAERHVLELRCQFDVERWQAACDGRADVALVALTSIHWRESWKYGERAFRYCQHDLGHAVAALVVGAAISGLRVHILPAWSQPAIGRLIGIDRDEDFVDAEREEPACLVAVHGGDPPQSIVNGCEALVTAAAAGEWSGQASQLSAEHVQWTFIDEIASATSDPGRPGQPGRRSRAAVAGGASDNDAAAADARALVLQRRSAVALDGQSSIDRASFFRMLKNVMPADSPPWDALWWTPRVHLALFVHRVADLDPGLYLLPRSDGARDRLRAACEHEFLWEAVHDDVPLVCLARGDCQRLSQRLSCDQNIAADGFFSLGMLAEFETSLAEHGPSFYRHLFWESGFIGQVLYLEAEAAGARATGIGCFYDDPVHETLGLRGHSYQSLYHFTVGIPVEDTRLTTAPGYRWT